MRQCSRLTFLTFFGGSGGDKERGGGADFFGLFPWGRGGINEVALSEGGTNDLAIT
jgi:hypothetical protein